MKDGQSPQKRRKKVIIMYVAFSVIFFSFLFAPDDLVWKRVEYLWEVSAREVWYKAVAFSIK